MVEILAWSLPVVALGFGILIGMTIRLKDDDDPLELEIGEPVWVKIDPRGEINMVPVDMVYERRLNEPSVFQVRFEDLTTFIEEQASNVTDE